MHFLAYDELERLLHDAPPARGHGEVRLICVRLGDAHTCPPRVTVSVDAGVVGDRWSAAADPARDKQVTVMWSVAAAILAGGHAAPDAAGDNFLVDVDLSVAALPVGARLRVGGALLEVSAKPHTGCKKFGDRFGLDAIRWVTAHTDLRLRGVNCRVIEGGEVAVGDAVTSER